MITISLFSMSEGLFQVSSFVSFLRFVNVQFLSVPPSERGPEKASGDLGPSSGGFQPSRKPQATEMKSLYLCRAPFFLSFLPCTEAVGAGEGDSCLGSRWGPQAASAFPGTRVPHPLPQLTS